VWYVPLGLILSFLALVYWHWPRRGEAAAWTEAEQP
jgi:hypothetical protein